MSLVFFVVGLIVGAAAAGLWGQGRARALHAALQARNAQAVLEVNHERALAEERVSAARARLEANRELEARQLNVEQMVRPIADQLGRVDAQLLSLKQEGARSQGMLAAQLRGMTEGQDRLRQETGALVSALRKPHVRGQWGQMQLRRVVELAGMVSHCDFSEQVSFTGPGGEGRQLRPDLVVSLPGGREVLVDAKAPLGALLDAHEARDQAARTRALTDHARLLRTHVRQLADKAYWAGRSASPDFVVLFLPGEHLLATALEADPGLIEAGMNQHVLIATPTTLLALLHSVGYGWQGERVAQSAQVISELGRELHGRIARLSGLLDTLGSRLNGTVRAYNEAVGSYESRVLPGARRFADLGAVGETSELAPVGQLSVAARSLRAVGSPGDEAGEAARTG